MIIIGLTGSIGMGKSQTAALFAEKNIWCYDADAAVHALYEKNGGAVGAISAAFPDTVRDGKVDRTALAARVLKNAAALKKLEIIVHPLARGVQLDFLTRAFKAQQNMVLLDIPLLFETGGDRFVDVVVVVSTAEEIQRARVLARPDMTLEKFADISAKQLPNAEKRTRADFIVDTTHSVASARRQVDEILQKLEGRVGTAYKKYVKIGAEK